MPKIESIIGHEVLDAHGSAAVQIVLTTSAGTQGIATASVRNVSVALAAVATQIQAALLGRSSSDQLALDHRLLELRATSNDAVPFNLLHAISVANARAESTYQGLPFYLYIKQLFPKRSLLLPRPHITILENAQGLIHQYSVIPIGACSLKDALYMGKKIYELISKNKEIQHSSSVDTILSILTHAAEQAGYTPQKDLVWRVQSHKTEAQELYTTWQERYTAIAFKDEVILQASSLSTISETLKSIFSAQEAKKKVAITTAEDTALVDLAVATGVEYILLGIPQHAENIMHYNRLLTIHTETDAPLVVY